MFNELTLKERTNVKSNQNAFIGLNGTNCYVIMHRSNVSEKDIKHLTQIDTKETICSICLETVTNRHILKCDHEFCRQCFEDWE